MNWRAATRRPREATLTRDSRDYVSASRKVLNERCEREGKSLARDARSSAARASGANRSRAEWSRVEPSGAERRRVPRNNSCAVLLFFRRVANIGSTLNDVI